MTTTHYVRLKAARFPGGFFYTRKAEHAPMSAELAGWITIVLGVPGFLVAIRQLRNKEQRRDRRTLRLSCWRVWGIEHVRLDVTDDQHR